MSVLVAGIDPGKTGGIAVLRADLVVPRIEAVWRMPTLHDRDIDWEMVWSILTKSGISYVCLEKVNAFRKAGATGSFEFGGAYYGMWAQIVASQIPRERVTPDDWQRVAWQGVTKRKKTKKGKDGKDVQANDTKNISLAAAQNLFAGQADLFIPPRCSTTHDGVVDAALIAYYAAMKLRGANKVGGYPDHIGLGD